MRISSNFFRGCSDDPLSFIYTTIMTRLLNKTVCYRFIVYQVFRSICLTYLEKQTRVHGTPEFRISDFQTFIRLLIFQLSHAGSQEKVPSIDYEKIRSAKIQNFKFFSMVKSFILRLSFGRGFLRIKVSRTKTSFSQKVIFKSS